MKVFLWLPRVLAIAFLLFISLFALDTLSDPQWLLALLIHLIPSYVIGALILLSWKNTRLGGATFIAAGILFLFFTQFQGGILSVPAIVIGCLFLGSTLAMKRKPSVG